MGLPVTIKVNFRGNVKRFLAQDLDKLEWESVEAWIKASFGINHFQVKYFDEDNEEICINSQSAEKQGNQLHMNVYKMKGQACGGPLKTEVKELKGDLRPAPPYPSRVKTVDKGTQVTPEREAQVTVKEKGSKSEDEPPPMWFRSYMEKFKDEVVKEVVERMCSDFSGQCCTHKSSDGPLEDSGASGGPVGPRPGPSTSNGSLGYTPNCSSCNKLTSEGAYKCVCPSCILCEMCRHSHDPSHNLVRTKTPLSIPEHGMSGELFPRRGDRTVRKAERQRLKAERRQLRAEVKEIKKKLRLEKRGLQWSGPSTSGRANLTNMASASTQVPALLPRADSETASGPATAHGPIPAPVPDPQASSPDPEVSPSSLVPTMAALFLDENLPDGTRLEPGTKFIKYWKMRNSGTISWTSETKLMFMWGNLGLASEKKREVPVPLLLPGQVGVVSVAFVAPMMEGTYTSHWRLAHCGCQFGPRVWCSIVDYYFPSVDLLTAQDLLSFELLDINIVQELEKVPNNTPVLTPCISPLPHDPPVWEKTITLSIREDKEFTLMEEDKEEEISGAQFLFETVIRSLTLEEAPDHRPPRRVCSQTSSASSCDDYIIVLPDCFDTSRPLGESMYSSAMSQPDITASAGAAVTSTNPDIQEETEDDRDSESAGTALLKDRPERTEVVSAEDSAPPPVLPIHSSVNQMLFASQTLDAVTLTPEVVSPPILPDPVVSPPTLYSPGITEGLVKGALSVAASAYKALFTGPNCTIQQRGIDPATRQDPSMMAMLLEMGFKNQRLNQRLLRKHSYSLLHTVNELVQ
uniref:NBR1 autophagy cargo receptor a n=1 Tax=Cynoglossus semilaevis TaxID=244447 RepID=A0A3P8WC11_CYNSE